MRTRLQHGKFVAPKTLAQGLVRREQLANEMAKIESQVNDPERQRRYHDQGNADRYPVWLRAAQQALRLFRAEARHLDAWIMAEQINQPLDLLRQAHMLLQELRDDEVEFDAAETKFLDTLDAFFRGQKEKR